MLRGSALAATLVASGLCVPMTASAAPGASESNASEAPAPEAPASEAPAPEAAPPSAEAARPESTPEGSADAGDETEADTPSVRPPRVDGGYFGVHGRGGVAIAKVMDLETDAPFPGAGGGIRVGDVVYPWMTIGLDVEGFFGRASAQGGQRLVSGQLLIDFGFLPKPEIPLSLRVAFGFGGGRVTQADGSTAGFGGAAFRSAVRYEFFPGAAKYRPRRGGGLGLGPELGWTFNTPARPDGPLAHTITLGMSLIWYRGR